ncbi:unnamed protein product [Psylliodes chrysocephalus]|uniref:BESS domain-containing protein n=1 Tax=Psylliodes chrysocephalus TaxID=3402493 RepID=A0A9P0CPX2_9CUCU|nr:unnamed protein product [Psylliodes chrysocephala]
MLQSNRFIKLPPSGSGAKKLSQKTTDVIKEMNFIRPYVKNSQDLPSNLLRLPSLENQDSNSGENIRDVEDIDPDGQSDCLRNSCHSTAKKVKTGRITNYKERKPDKDCEVDSYVTEYLKRKQVNSDNPKQLFLLSLLPDLEQMDNHQMRQFRCKVSQLIDDDILTTLALGSWQTINSHQGILASNQLSTQPADVQDWLRSTTGHLQNSQENPEYDLSAWLE